jgi:3-oxoacyl-[acyl-carrier-protein] synthase III
VRDSSSAQEAETNSSANGTKTRVNIVCRDGFLTPEAPAAVIRRSVSAMSGFTILGTGRYLPGRPYTNHDLARVMDTEDEWIFKRTGIRQRHFCPEGLGVADLALPAAQQALAAANLAPEDIDYVLFNTMTPDHVWPGSGALLAAKLGCPGIPALDLRTQCAACIFSLQVANGLFMSGAARRILVVGAESHAGFMPWRDWDILEGTTDRKPSAEDWDRATRHRGLAILFGDGAGAIVLGKTDRPGTGLHGIDVHSDGRTPSSSSCLPASARARGSRRERCATRR